MHTGGQRAERESCSSYASLPCLTGLFSWPAGFQQRLKARVPEREVGSSTFVFVLNNEWVQAPEEPMPWVLLLALFEKQCCTHVGAAERGLQASAVDARATVLHVMRIFRDQFNKCIKQSVHPHGRQLFQTGAAAPKVRQSLGFKGYTAAIHAWPKVTPPNSCKRLEDASLDCAVTWHRVGRHTWRITVACPACSDMSQGLPQVERPREGQGGVAWWFGAVRSVPHALPPMPLQHHRRPATSQGGIIMANGQVRFMWLLWPVRVCRMPCLP